MQLRINTAKLFLIPRSKLKKLFLLQKQDVVYACYFTGILIAYLGSLNPWFMWSFFGVFPVITSVPIVVAMLMSSHLSHPLFTRENYLSTFGAYLLLVVMMALVDGRNINGYIFLVFNAIIFYSLFRLETEGLLRVGTFLAKFMAILMCISIPFYVLYLIGFPLPHYHIANEEFHYYFENFRFFLLDDRDTMLFVPRFHSVFLEPGHLGTACTFLLLTQIGKWKKWYNIILLVTTLMTFSLAAYVLLAMTFFGAAWIQRKAIVGKLIALLLVLSAIVLASIFYNKGDNMVNQLIVQRLTVDEDGKLEGDNRVTGMFETEYERYIQSEDILWGREYVSMKYGWGNAGYRVFIFKNGIIVLAMLIAFYLIFSLQGPDRRVTLVMLTIAFTSFMVRAIPLSYYYFIPLYILTLAGVDKDLELPHTTEESRQNDII